jgi:hypothetical protein
MVANGRYAFNKKLNELTYTSLLRSRTLTRGIAQNHLFCNVSLSQPYRTASNANPIFFSRLNTLNLRKIVYELIST